jgi:metal-responsive CopG/Arc/MetJ family transcriptional regulator
MGKAPLVPGQVGKSPYLSLRIPAHQLAAVDKRARLRSVSRSQVVREAIDALLEEEAATA